MKILLLSLGAVLYAGGVFAESPMLPPLTKKFVVNCEVDLDVVDEDGKGRQNDFSSLSAKISLNNSDFRKGKLKQSIKWKTWSYSKQKMVSSSLRLLPGQPNLVSSDLYAVGAHDQSGRLGQYDVELKFEFWARDKKSKLGVLSSVRGTRDSSLVQVNKSEASQRFRDHEYKYILKLACDSK